jgi:hypothetical protein
MRGDRRGETEEGSVKAFFEIEKRRTKHQARERREERKNSAEF